MTLNELVYELMTLYRPNMTVTDSLDERNFAHWIQATRAKLIKQRLDEGMRVPDEHWVQDLGAVQVSPIDSSVYSAIPSNKYMLRTVNTIPWTIHSKGDPGAFTRIGPTDKLSVNFRQVTYDRALVSGNGKFNKDTIYAFIDGQYISLISGSNIHKQLTHIHIKGVFENPIEAYEFRYGTSYNWDYDYPVSVSLVNDMKNIIVSENFNLTLVPIDDKKTDSTDNVTKPFSNEEVNSINPNIRTRK